MHIEDPRWDEYERRFRAIAKKIELHKGPHPEVASAQVHLCLYGENGLTPEKEFAMLAKLEESPNAVKGIEILTSYWEDLVLYLL